MDHLLNASVYARMPVNLSCKCTQTRSTKLALLNYAHTFLHAFCPILRLPQYCASLVYGVSILLLLPCLLPLGSSIQFSTATYGSTLYTTSNGDHLQS